MKAVQINSYGGNEVLEISDAPTPEVKPGQILVKNHAASVNPFDWKVRTGYMKDATKLPFPLTLGGDFSGVVTQIAEDVAAFAIGDEVYGSANIFGGGSGAFAEEVAANEKNSAKKQKEASFEETAALVLTGVSAIQALEESMKLQSGQKVLIHGGAGGIGTASIQLAKSLGAYVAVTVSTNDIDFVKQLGADEVIDYKTEKFEEKLKDFDAVYDTIGGETTTNSFTVLKQGGVLVSMMGQPDEALAKEHSVTAIGQATMITTERLNRLSDLIASGKMKAQIEKTFPLDQAKDAMQYVEEVHPRGKVVLKIA